MARLRNSVTGAVVNVSDDVAGRLGSAWVPADQSSSEDSQPKEKPAPRRSRKASDD